MSTTAGEGVDRRAGRRPERWRTGRRLTRLARGRPDDRGQAGGIEVLPFGVLIFVIGSLLVVNVWGVVDAKLAADAGAREATRRFVEAEVTDPRRTAEAEAAAVAAGRAAVAAHGRDPARATVALTGLEGPDGRSGFTRCARATFTVTYHVPALALPWIGGYGDGFDVSSSHSELVDPFRDGVPGDAGACS